MKMKMMILAMLLVSGCCTLTETEQVGRVTAMRDASGTKCRLAPEVTIGARMIWRRCGMRWMAMWRLM